MTESDSEKGKTIRSLILKEKDCKKSPLFFVSQKSTNAWCHHFLVVLQVNKFYRVILEVKLMLIGKLNRKCPMQDMLHCLMISASRS